MSHETAQEHIAQDNTTSLFCDLPPELHIEVFSHLDLIDSTCLGLTNNHFYSLHRALHGSVPLNTRRKGPNKLESVWKGYDSKSCSMCGIYRCELHMHVRSVIPDTHEYCAIRGKFGPKSEDGSHPSCYRSVPPNPTVCGRHSLPGEKKSGRTMRIIEAGRVPAIVAATA